MNELEINTREGFDTPRLHTLNVLRFSVDGGKKIITFADSFFFKSRKALASSILRSELSETSKRLTMGDMVS